MSGLWVLFLLLVVPSVSIAQSGSRESEATTSAMQRLEFEVATIKPTTPGGYLAGVNVVSGGRVQIRSVPLTGLICIAFHVGYWQVSGGETWTEKTMFDVEAEPSEALPGSKPYDTRHTAIEIQDDRLREMLQALLVDRFRLKLHRDAKTGTVYLLERSGKTLALKPTKETESSPHPSGEIGWIKGRGWIVRDTSMPELASFLSRNVLQQPVWDRTGVNGAFDFESASILTDGDYHGDMTGTFLPVLSRIGLKLQKTTGPVEMLVIDHAEPPTAN